MITDKPISNIFQTRNDWALNTLKCSRYVKYGPSAVIRNAVIEVFGYDPYLDVKSRKREKVEARQVYMVMAAQLTNQTQENITKYIDKDHSTLPHAMKSVQNEYDTNKIFAEKINRVRKKIKIKLDNSYN